MLYKVGYFTGLRPIRLWSCGQALPCRAWHAMAMSRHAREAHALDAMSGASVRPNGVPRQSFPPRGVPRQSLSACARSMVVSSGRWLTQATYFQSCPLPWSPSVSGLVVLHGRGCVLALGPSRDEAQGQPIPLRASQRTGQSSDQVGGVERAGLGQPWLEYKGLLGQLGLSGRLGGSPLLLPDRMLRNTND